MEEEAEEKERKRLEAEAEEKEKVRKRLEAEAEDQKAAKEKAAAEEQRLLKGFIFLQKAVRIRLAAAAEQHKRLAEETDEAARMSKEEEAEEEAAPMANQSPLRNLWGTIKTAVFGKEIQTSPPALQKVQEEAQQEVVEEDNEEIRELRAQRFASKLRNKCMFEGAFDWETCGAEAGACFDTVPYSDGLFFNGPLTISVPLDDKQEDGSDEDSTVTDEDDEEDDGLFNESDAEPGGDIFYIVQLPYDFKDHSTNCLAAIKEISPKRRPSSNGVLRPLLRSFMFYFFN